MSLLVNTPTTKELLDEFIRVYKQGYLPAKEGAEAVVILGTNGNSEEETVSRIRHGIRVFQQLQSRPLIIFSGVTEERNHVLNLLQKYGAPSNQIYFQNCGDRVSANTKTQFEVMSSDPLTRDLRELVIITSSYHVPRTERTAGKFLHPKTIFSVSSDPEDYLIFNTFLKILGEIERIKAYSQKGDILEKPRP